MIPYPISEIVDRYTICLLKTERTDENLNEELQLYEKEIDSYRPSIESFITELYDINGEIWDLESDIRKGKEEELGLDEVGRRAIQIREKNKQRVTIKNLIVDFYGEGYKDIKINHGSE